MHETTGIPETNEGGRTYWKKTEALSKAESGGIRGGGLETELAGSVGTEALLRAESGGNIEQLGTELAESVREVGNRSVGGLTRTKDLLTTFPYTAL